MGFRFRKSIRVGKSGRINLSKSGVGGSFGVKGYRVGVGPRGGRVNASVPGTGIGYEARTGTGGSRQRGRNQSAQALESSKRRSCGCLPTKLLVVALVIAIAILLIGRLS